ncbi:MAG: Gfo/Idh/MocA family oxidoreductase [bacterium]
MTSKPVRVAILGAGGRGQMFGRVLAELPHLAQVVAVAEPRDAYRELFAAAHGLPPAQVFRTWEEFLKKPPPCDAVVIATMDRDHVHSAVACLSQGLHLMLEKPMATTLADCRAIEAAQRKAGALVAVCHSMRYHKGFATLRDVVASGRIGEVVSMDQLEQVAFWHQAHSFVRGNWGNEGRATFMLLAKSCHDLDYMAFLIGRPCRRVSSFGALSHFNRAHAPAGATARCTDGCPAEATCPYSALKQYVYAEHLNHWPADVVSPVHTREAHLEALRTGPYGRCVYQCDNDVVDHQVVAMDFEGDITATFTMTAFTQRGGRQVRVHGTEGEASFDEQAITVRSFRTNDVETTVIGPEVGGHGGGDNRVVRDWLDAIRLQAPERIRTSAQESLRTHTIVFAAERSRLERRTIELSEM